MAIPEYRQLWRIAGSANLALGVQDNVRTILPDGISPPMQLYLATFRELESEENKKE